MSNGHQIEGGCVLDRRAVVLVLKDGAVQLTTKHLSSIDCGENQTATNNGADLLVQLGNLA